MFDMKMKNTQNHTKSAALGFLSKGLKNEFEPAVVNEPSVIKPLKFYCIASNAMLAIDGLTKLCIGTWQKKIINDNK